MASPIRCFLLALATVIGFQCVEAARTRLRNFVAGRHFAEAGTIRLRELEPRKEVRKPLTDKREYTHALFDSGLRVLAVRDPDAEKSSFAVAVEAGSLEDPPDFQGLAHFCEHMLFLGSKKYPSKDAFSEQLALFGGTHNAYTSAEETVYFNEIGNDGYEKGLDIFAQFFIAPTFDEAMVDKEIHAVDSEHKKNQPDTQRRLWHLLRSKANPKNPMHQFSTGDLRTLKTQPEKDGKSLVQALRKFHDSNYCSNRLHLVLVSNRTIEEQMELAHKYFDDVPKSTPVTCPSRPMYTSLVPYSKELGNVGRQWTLGTTGTPEMWIMFPMPSLKKHYKEIAEAYLWNALGNYGPGSLKSLLKEEDLSQSYSYYAENSVAGSVVFVTFSLTEKGAKNTDKILEHFFAYFAAIKKEGVNDELLKSMQAMRQVEFDYQEKKSSEFDFVQGIAGSISSYEPEDLLTGGVLIDHPDKKLITEVLASLTPDNMNIALVSPAFNKTSDSSHEEYYDFSYDDKPIASKFIEDLAKATDKSLVPPKKLLYVPQNLEIIKEGVGEEGPKQLRKDSAVELWWLGQGKDLVKLPKAIISMKLAFPESVLARVQDTVLSAMHVRLINMALEEPADALQMCGLSYSISAHNDGLGISFSGFDEHILELVKMVLPRLREPGNAKQDFEMVRRQLVLDLSDVTRMQPYQHALEAFEVVTVKDRYARSEVRRTAEDKKLVNLDTYKNFLSELFAKSQLTLLYTGNMDQARSLETTKTIESLMQMKVSKDQIPDGGHLQVINPKEEIEIRVQNPIVDDPNSATIAAYQFGVPTVKDLVHISMLGEIIDRPVFETLRTEHQLGYVVFGYVTSHASIAEVRVLVQGFRERPDVVGDLIEGTVQNLTSRIASMDLKEFNTRKQTLRQSLSKKTSTMGQFAGKYWNQIWEQNYCFQKQEWKIKYLDSEGFNSPAPLLEAWKKMVTPSKDRKKVTVKLFGTQPGVNDLEEKVEGAKVVTKIDSSDVEEQMKGEEYWPHEYVCKDPLAA
eukprot:gnl/TRDRNA2_/TRDRNA2_35769_c0_seq1.p1 gnl/TRDRNA2_/TRDRNA2_35769_c0~~gnl/TRDRNA2_/TRDRNA2_35769_c0_seq1.p1  ORF type:complete len:1021 (+),score=241.79 gnl/TRDRNA2_/TRDRNA2_35769_c0_seq1:163-3225(+)